MADFSLEDLIGTVVCFAILAAVVYAVDRVSKRRRRDGRR